MGPMRASERQQERPRWRVGDSVLLRPRQVQTCLWSVRAAGPKSLKAATREGSGLCPGGSGWGEDEEPTTGWVERIKGAGAQGRWLVICWHCRSSAM